MLDVNKIGQKIACLRKSLNMTQAALAEKLFVSYQAVSSWERGLTLPDIDKLKDLSELFNCSIDDIIGSDGKKVADIVEGKTPSLSDISDVAQIIEPKRLDELVEAAVANDSDFNSSHTEVSKIIALAPFISKELLVKLLDEFDSLSIDDITALLPFLDKNKINYFAQNIAVENLEELVVIAPFLDKCDLDALVDKINRDKLINVFMLAPFLSRDKLIELKSKLADTAPDTAMMLEPFISGSKQ